MPMPKKRRRTSIYSSSRSEDTAEAEDAPHTSTPGIAAAALPAWLRRAGVWWDVDTLHFAVSPLHGAGVFASRDIQPGERIARIPKSKCLCVRTSGARRRLEALVAEGTVDEELALALAILYEWRRVKRSPWAGYFRCLAHDTPHTPLAWTPAEQALLHGTECDSCDNAGWQRNAQQQKAAEAATLFEGMTPLFRRVLPGKEPVSFAEFLAAQYWIESRAFKIDDALGEGLVPLADLFNHKAAVLPRNGEVKRGHRQGSRAQALDIAVKHSGPRAAGISIVTVSHISCGQEIFNCYGELGNARLLANYGFICADNPHDAIVFRPATLVRAAVSLGMGTHREVRARLLRRLAPWRFVSAPAIRREVNRSDDDGEHELDSSTDDSNLGDEGFRGFTIGVAGTLPATLLRVAQAARPGRLRRCRAKAAAPVLCAAIQERRLELKSAAIAKAPRGHGRRLRNGSTQTGFYGGISGHNISPARAALARQVREGELRILDAMQRVLRHC